MTHTTVLNLSWGISRGRETYGYTIARLEDTSTGERFRCMGGGYDMQGTVFGEWLQETHQSALLELAHAGRAHAVIDGPSIDRRRHPVDSGLYGMTYRTEYAFIPEKPDGERIPERVTLDGACGLESMVRIADAIGLTVKRICNRRGHLTGLVVSQADTSAVEATRPPDTGGERVELHPATDAWMRGDRYGSIVRHGRKYVHVRMDRSGRTLRMLPELVKAVAA